MVRSLPGSHNVEEQGTGQSGVEICAHRHSVIRHTGHRTDRQ